VFSGGEYVIYGIQPDGRLLWYRHDGAGQGSTDWRGAVEVGAGWQNFLHVFSGGDGTIYGIRPDGVLERRIHRGYLDGTLDWSGAEEIGTGWAGFREVVAAADGVLYAFTRDGRILWYRYGKRPPLPEQPAPDIGIVDVFPGGLGGLVVERPGSSTPGSSGGLATPLDRSAIERGVQIGPSGPAVDVRERPADIEQYLDPAMERWEGPVEVKRNFPAFRAVFVRLGEPYRGPN